MQRYRILNTETTIDFAKGLMGDIYNGQQEGKYINLNTADGKLLFTSEEVEEV